MIGKTGRLAAGVAALAVIVPFTACSGTRDEVRGGADALPGPVPAGVTFQSPASDAPPAPDFTATLMDGAEVTGSTLWRDRPAVLVFFSSWCTQCEEQQAGLNEIAQTYADQILFFGIAGEDSRAELESFLDTQDVDYPVTMDSDGAIWRAYAVREPPALVIVSKEGRLLRGWPGGLTAGAVEEQLRALVLTAP